MCNHFPNIMFLNNQKNPPFYRYNVYCAAHMSQKLYLSYGLWYVEVASIAEADCVYEALLLLASHLTRLSLSYLSR